ARLAGPACRFGRLAARPVPASGSVAGRASDPAARPAGRLGPLAVSAARLVFGFSGSRSTPWFFLPTVSDNFYQPLPFQPHLLGLARRSSPLSGTRYHSMNCGPRILSH